MRLIYALLLGALFCILPELILEHATTEFWKQFGGVLKELTYDSVLAWVFLFSRRFIFLELPKRILLVYARPFIPRAIRMGINRFIQRIIDAVLYRVERMRTRLGWLVSLPMLCIMSLGVGVAVFVVVYHYTGHLVIVFFGAWHFVKPYAWLFAQLWQLIQQQLLRFVVFFKLEWVGKMLSRVFPSHWFQFVRGQLQRLLRWQVRVRSRSEQRIEKQLTEYKERRRYRNHLKNMSTLRESEQL